MHGSGSESHVLLRRKYAEIKYFPTEPVEARMGLVFFKLQSEFQRNKSTIKMLKTLETKFAAVDNKL